MLPRGTFGEVFKRVGSRSVDLGVWSKVPVRGPFVQGGVHGSHHIVYQVS